jgi:16S rRNA (guanine527-N7)-methyltransferase
MKEILKYFPQLSDTQKGLYQEMVQVYTELNERTNVISRQDIDQIVIRHILHSLAIAKFTSFEDGSVILDAGTGGGFPGIPLAVMFPEVHFVLNDAILRKIRLVQEVIDRLGLTNAEAVHGRMEKMKGPYDFVLSRAVAEMGWFFPRVRKSISSEQKNELINGVIYLKGGDLTKELQGFPEARIEAISQWFDEEFFETKKIVYIGARS